VVILNISKGIIMIVAISTSMIINRIINGPDGPYTAHLTFKKFEMFAMCHLFKQNIFSELLKLLMDNCCVCKWSEIVFEADGPV